jgi:phage tail tape-measure protein
VSLDVSMILKLVDRFTAPAKKAQAGAKALAGKAGIGALEKSGAAAAAGLGKTERAAGRLPGVFNRASTAIGRFSLRALPAMNKGAELAGRGIGKLLKMGGQLALRGASWAAVGTGAAIGGFFGGIIGTASKFEQFQVILENTEGSAAKAKASMAWVKNFAKTTPYEIGEVMNAFVKMRAYGIDPTQGALTSLGNAASGMGKDLMDAIEMIADAQTGEFERLKEFGIKAKQSGDQVTFSWSKNGKDMTKTSKRSASDIRSAVLGIFDQNFGGMMDRQSRTLAGMWSNLKDSVSNFELEIGNAGIFDLMKVKVQRLLDKVNELTANGTLARWAQQISEKFEAAVKWATSFSQTDFNNFISGLKTVGQALGVVVTGLQNAFGWAKLFGDMMIRNERISLQSIAGNGRVAVDVGGVRLWGQTPQERADAKRRLREMDVDSPGPEKNYPQGHMRPGMYSGRPITLPATGKKTSAVDVRNELHVRVSTPPGVLASVTPSKVAPGSLIKVTRDRMGPAMAGV